MIVRRCNVDSSWRKAFAFSGELRVKGLVSAQAPGERFSRIVRRQMLNDDDGGIQVGWQLTDDPIESLQPPFTGTYHDDVESIVVRGWKGCLSHVDSSSVMKVKYCLSGDLRFFDAS
jgi:hypothetical protein